MRKGMVMLLAALVLALPVGAAAQSNAPQTASEAFQTPTVRLMLRPDDRNLRARLRSDSAAPMASLPKDRVRGPSIAPKVGVALVIPPAQR